MDKFLLKEQIEKGLSTYKLAKYFKKGNSTITYWIKKLNLVELYKSKSTYKPIENKPNYKKEDLEIIIKNSFSYSEVLQKLDIVPRGGNFKTIQKYIDLYKIDISHFNPYINRKNVFKRDINYYLREDINIGSSSLKERLYKENIKEKICELCGQDESWKGKKMSLILDHINGIHTDNRLDNLRIVCPNCNATLETHCGKHTKKKRTYIKSFAKNVTEKVNYKDKLLTKGIDIEILKKEVWEVPCITLAKKYNMSDNGLGKICKKFNIPKPERGYWSKNSNIGKLNNPPVLETGDSKFES